MTRIENSRTWWPQCWRAAVAPCALAVAAALLAAPAAARSDAVIWEGDDQSVFLASQDGETAQPNDHPADVAPQDIERMLARLKYRRADQEADTPAMVVFNKAQVEILGRTLATGLARASPSQDVVFSIVGAHRLSPGAFVRRNRLTAGRAFFRQGKLNIIFGEIQSPYRKKNIYGRLDEDFYPRRYGSRAAPAEQELVLIASATAELRRGPAGTRDDWVELDPALEPEAAETDDIEQRLRTLKRLREKGLISEDGYRKKVEEILAEL